MEFYYSGTYRVQSRTATAPSELGGGWMPASPDLLDSGRVNEALARHPSWCGKAAVTLRPVLVTHRVGLFATEPDILYKKVFFRANPDTVEMADDIIDVRKSADFWALRRPHLVALFGEVGYEAVTTLLGDIETVIGNEYYLHEAGHFLGYDVLSKYDQGYFSVAGRTAWPLIYLEEFRADMQSFSFALELLPRAKAVAVFLYNLFLRFGVHREGLCEAGVARYGAIPYLLFHFLRSLGFLSVDRSRARAPIVLASLDDSVLADVMRLCSTHAERELTGCEVSRPDPTEIALHGARYVRRRMDDLAALREFQAAVELVGITPHLEGAQ